MYETIRISFSSKNYFYLTVGDFGFKCVSKIGRFASDLHWQHTSKPSSQCFYDTLKVPAGATAVNMLGVVNLGDPAGQTYPKYGI